VRSPGREPQPRRRPRRPNPMDIRRGPPPPRAAFGGVEPRFRQVGFVTAAEPVRGAATPAPASPAASDGLSPVMIPPPLIPVPVAPASESLAPSSPPPDSSSRPDAVSDFDDDDDIDVSWARPPPPAFPGTWPVHLCRRTSIHTGISV
jgi:translation initiation factor eIF-2B subunit delta